MRKAFTLIELLLVMGIMGLLGTISVGGYRAMQRGMEERGVMQNVNSFVRAAYQRAQIDRQPVAIYFWNETLRSETDDQNAVVVGRAVAVRRYGRFSAVRSGMLIDEFADLNLTYGPIGDDETEASSSKSKGSTRFVYPMEKLADVKSDSDLRRTTVEGMVKDASETVNFLTKDPEEPVEGAQDLKVPAWGFVIASSDRGNVSWKPGMAYGMEFLRIELPHNYIFGSQFSSSSEDPVRGMGTIVFKVGIGGNGLVTGGSEGRNSIDVCSLRPSSGTLKAERVAASDNPEKDL